jgi:hypothetical protein
MTAGGVNWLQVFLPSVVCANDRVARVQQQQLNMSAKEIFLLMVVMMAVQRSLEMIFVCCDRGARRQRIHPIEKIMM